MANHQVIGRGIHLYYATHVKQYEQVRKQMFCDYILSMCVVYVVCINGLDGEEV